MNKAAYDEVARDWPEAIAARPEHTRHGLEMDSLHSAPFVAIQDVVADEAERWKIIEGCDVSRNWSACVGTIPGRGLRAYFCELAYAQAALHATASDADDWPDTGLPCEPGWWRKPIADFEAQVRLHCMACGIPLRRPGKPAVSDPTAAEEFSRTHAAIARPKVKARPVEFVESIGFAGRGERPSTQYLPHVTPGYRGD